MNISDWQLIGIITFSFSVGTLSEILTPVVNSIQITTYGIFALIGFALFSYPLICGRKTGED